MDVPDGMGRTSEKVGYAESSRGRQMRLSSKGPWRAASLRLTEFGVRYEVGVVIQGGPKETRTGGVHKK